jgi:hypothetical protein
VLTSVNGTPGGPFQLDKPEAFLRCITPNRRDGVPSGLVHLEVWKRLTAHGVAGRALLDYASGAGDWAFDSPKKAPAFEDSTSRR